MLFGILEDFSWIYFTHTYLLPLYTYWYYFGPFIIITIPALRFSYIIIKYILKVILLISTDLLNFLIETTTPASNFPSSYISQKKINSKMTLENDIDNNEENEEDLSTPSLENIKSEYNIASAEDILENIHKAVTKIARYFILFFILLVPIWLILSIPFIYYDSHMDCNQEYIKHLNNVRECDEKGYEAQDFMDLCIRSKKEIQKSVLYCSLSKTKESLQIFLWNTICSPFVMIYLSVIILLTLARSGIRIFNNGSKIVKYKKDYPYFLSDEKKNQVSKMKNVSIYPGKDSECILKMD